jgi:hypothetical protein
MTRGVVSDVFIVYCERDICVDPVVLMSDIMSIDMLADSILP